MSQPPANSDLFEALVDEYRDRKRCGESPSISEYCHANPDLAEEICDPFPHAS